jgi:CRISPR-associated endonuclease/helicase Cas3
MQIELTDCWAKTDEKGYPCVSVSSHCLCVGAVSEALRQLLPPSLASFFPKGGSALVAAHDIGKISPGFLLKSAEWRMRWQTILALSADGHETRHAWTSQKFLAKHYAKPPKWLIAVGGHHGRYLCSNAIPAEIAPKSIGGGVFADLRNELLQILENQFGELPPAEEIERGARLHWFTGFMVFCDWIGSNTTWFPHRIETCRPQIITEQANKALDAVGNHRHGVLQAKSFRDLFGFDEPRPLQKSLIDAMDAPGLYIVEAPMGDGKTEAALAGAYRRWTEGGERGLYFALPTQLTSNRIRDRVEEFIKRIVSEQSALALVHGNAWLYDNRIRPLEPQPLGGDAKESDNAGEANRWFSDSRRAMLAPFGVGTIDQALMAVVPVKYSALRMFGLGGKVVVIDEVHSYDSFTSALVDRLVKWLIELGGSVVVLSATLTAARRASLVAAAGAWEENAPQNYPLITKVTTGKPVAEHIPMDGPLPADKEVSIQAFPASDECWMNEVAKAAKNGACVLVIRNTVELARGTYRALKNHCLESGIAFGLIHSRFTQADRAQNETLWTDFLGRDGSSRPRQGAVLVGTQVLEQSLDIDADLLITDLAPTDLILQRIGRLHRHQRPRPFGCKKPLCILLRPDVDWSATRAEVEKALSPHRFIYPPFSLYMADTVWSDLRLIHLPSGIRPALENSSRVPETMPAAVREFLEEMERKTDRMLRVASMNAIFSMPASGDTEGAETRWNMQPTAWIVVLAKQPSQSGHRIDLAFPDGTTRSFEDAAFDFALARSLQLHAIRVPAYLVRGLQRPAWLSNHLPDAVLTVKDETNRLQVSPEADSPYEFSYSQETGLGFSKTQNDTRYNPHEDESWY